ncbi:hypothetical protein LTR85_003431 [Meristemomyces frigidus]|nr:hypothetical protein LTR85_003431 [Meristemomyces frigidus]
MAALSFMCSVCFDQKSQTTPPRTIESSSVCHDCSLMLLPLFEAALCEYNYPVKWGQGEIPVTEFSDLLGEDFVSRFQRRQIKYNTALADRLYCRNQLLASSGTLMGATTDVLLALTPAQISAAAEEGIELVFCDAMAAPRSETDGRSQSCYHCGGSTCLECELPVFAGVIHNCLSNDSTPADDRFAGLVRGREYQRCPDPLCGNVYELFDGCNHIACPIAACQTDFCFICGDKVDFSSGHWDTGKPCPRYNQPSDPNAAYDDVATTIAANRQRSQQLLDERQLVLEAPSQGRGWFDVSDRME